LISSALGLFWSNCKLFIFKIPALGTDFSNTGLC